MGPHRAATAAGGERCVCARAGTAMGMREPFRQPALLLVRDNVFLHPSHRSATLQRHRHRPLSWVMPNRYVLAPLLRSVQTI